MLVGAVVVVCLVGPASALGGPSDPTTTDHALGSAGVAHQREGDTAGRTIRIGVRQNGSGVVTVRYRFALAGANETAAFERLRKNITTNALQYRARFGARMDRVVASAQTTTGRKMSVTNLTVNATRRGTTGVVTYSFIWRGFAATAGDRIRVGDALEGFYLDNGTRLIIAWPAAYEPTTVRPSPDERHTQSVSWNASTTFDGNEPFVELAPAGSAPNTRSQSNGSNIRTQPNGSNASGVAGGRSNSSTATTGTTEPTTTAGGGSDTTANGASNARTDTGPNTAADSGSDTAANDGSAVGPLLPVIGIGVVLGTVVLVAWVGYRRREDEDRSRTDESTVSNTGTDDAKPPDEAAANQSQTELLSNEERVVAVLERAGGRAKQQDVVAELGWTEAKTSQVVGKLREKGRINGFRLGRENVLVVPDEQGTTGDHDDPSG